MGKFFKRKSFKKWKSFLDLDRLRQEREPDGLPVSFDARVQPHDFSARGRALIFWLQCDFLISHLSPVEDL